MASLYHLCLLSLLALVCCCYSHRQDGAVWVLAAYRVRKSYAYTENDGSLPNIQDLLKILDFDKNTTLRQMDSFTSCQGAVVMRLVEFHNDRMVKGSQMDVSLKADGSIERVGGRVTRGLGKALRKYIRHNCKLFEKGAERIAMEHEGIQPHQVQIERTHISKDLVVTEEGSAYITVTADITWVVPDTDVGNVTRKIFTIDACQKTVLDVELHLADVYKTDTEVQKSAEGLDFLNYINNTRPEKRIPCESPASGFGGNLKIGVTQYGMRPYCLDLVFVNDTCFLQNKYVRVVDMHNDIGSDPRQVVNFRCHDGYNDTINGGYSVALDTFFHVTQTISMYNDWYGFQPLPDTRAMVHFDRRMDNAYWDGRTLIVGDGGEGDTFPFSTLDTVAHEISHGVTEHRSGLHYSGESGAINEAFSDMAGEAVEVYLRGHNDWVVGADVIKAGGQGIRYFEDPTRDGISIGHVKDFQSDMDVHRSSGIFNKAFYLVAQSLGVRDAFQPFVVANRLYWREKSTFEEAACDVIKASYDSGFPMEVFTAAFRAVGLQLTLCQDLDQFMVKLNMNETRTQLSVSKTVQPMFIVEPPRSANTVDIDISGATNSTIIILSKSFQRNDDDVLIRINGSSLRYNFLEKSVQPLYLKIVGEDEDINIHSLEAIFL